MKEIAGRQCPDPAGSSWTRKRPSASSRRRARTSRSSSSGRKARRKVTIYEQGGFRRLLPRPARPLDRASSGTSSSFRCPAPTGRATRRASSSSASTAPPSSTKKELDDYLRLLEEAKKRDHRRLGQELDLFSTSEDLGGGLILWHPKGARIRAVIEQYWRERHWEGGYDILYTPHIGREVLWQTSGHLGFYKDSMYSPMDIDEQNYYLKPMNCPFHIQIYKSRLRSYRDLPLRWAELGTVYRYERSGTLHGLLRVRGFTQDDAHIICTPEQIEDEILRVLDFSISILAAFGFTDNKIELSVRDPKNPAKYCGSDDAVVPGRGLAGQGPRGPRASPTSGWRARPSSTAPRSTSRSRTPSAATGSARPSSSTSTCRSGST